MRKIVINFTLLFLLVLAAVPTYVKADSCGASCACKVEQSCHSKKTCDTAPFKACCIKKASKDSPAVIIQNLNNVTFILLDQSIQFTLKVKRSFDLDKTYVTAPIKSPPIHILKSSFLI